MSRTCRSVSYAWRVLDRLRPKSSPIQDLEGVKALEGVYGGILLTRMPLTLPPKPKWETEYLDWQRQWHERTSVYKEWNQDWLTSSSSSSSTTSTTGSGGASSSGSSGDREGVKRPAPLEQEADRTGDRKTTKRRLDSHLYLLLKRKETCSFSSTSTSSEGGGKEELWYFPHVAHEEKESIRLTCERALATCIEQEEGTQTFFIGNGPCGMLPATGDWNTMEEERSGKVFLIPVEVIKGQPQLSEQVKQEVEDFAWVAKDEMNEYFKCKETQEYLQKLLQDKSDYYGSGTSQTY